MKLRTVLDRTLGGGLLAWIVLGISLVVCVLVGADRIWSRACAPQATADSLSVLPDFAIGQRVRNIVDNQAGIVMGIDGRMVKVRQLVEGYNLAERYVDYWWPAETLYPAEEIPQVDVQDIVKWAATRPTGD